MNSLITFWLESGLALAVFYGYNYFVLRKRPDLQFNRFFLLGAMAASLLVPFLHFAWPGSAPPERVEAFLPGHWLADFEEFAVSGPDDTAWLSDWKHVVLLLYVFGSALLFARMAVQAVRLVLLIRRHPVLRTGNLNLVRLQKNHPPFSVFNYIFTGDTPSDAEAMEGILRHEWAHVRLHHSADMIFAELVCILLWFNPVAYLFRRSLREIHEYQADRSTLDSGFPAGTYMKLLAGMAAHQHFSAPASMFSNSLTKKRLIMINRKNHNTGNLTGKIMLLPLVLAVVLCFGFEFRTNITIPHPATGSASASFTVPKNRDVPSGMPFGENAEVRITSGYGMRKHPETGKMAMHDGIDMAVPEGTPVIATAKGTVEKAEFISGKQGNMVLIAHEQGYTTLYTHLQKFSVSVGQKVGKGEMIGYSGNSGYSTGPHLHYEIRKDGKSIDPSGTFE